MVQRVRVAFGNFGLNVQEEIAGLADKNHKDAENQNAPGCESLGALRAF